MSTVPRLINQRRKRRSKAQHSLLRRLTRTGTITLAMAGILFAAAFAWTALTYSSITTSLPSLEQLPLLLEPPGAHLLQPTRLYDRTGEHILLTLENPAMSQRRYLPLSDQASPNALSQNLVNAVIAISDPAFWEHSGFTSASLNSATPRTLTQRLVADLLLWGEPDSQQRRWRESLLAAQATSRFGRETILEWYLNSADYGHFAYGADSAAQVYFGKSAANLTLAESALLAAVAQSPDLNPIDAPQLAIERQGKVLEAMLAQGYITTDQAVNANLLPLEIKPVTPFPDNPYQPFTDLVLAQLSQRFGLSRLQRGGLQIITTLDLDLQSQSACAADAQIARLTDQPAEETDCQAARLLPSLRREDAAAAPGVAANVVVIDPGTGQVLALVGDVTAGRTPGSLLSPFVYLTAFTRGFSPASLVWDIPAALPPELAGYGNPDGEFHGPVRMRIALANDYIAPAVQTLNQIGPENVWRTAQQSGLNSVDPSFGETSPRLLLDSGAVPLLEATHAYAMLANQGFLAGQPALADASNGPPPMQPASVLKVLDYNNRALLDWQQPQIRSVTSAQLAYLITHVLSDEDARRPSLGRPNVLEVGRPAAAKLGQTTNQLDTWTVGYTPQLAVGVWVGYPNSTETAPLSPTIAAGLWNAVLKYSHLELPLANWDVPAGITEINVCDPSGLLPTVDCPTTVSEIFIPGNEPIQLDNLFRAIEINRLTSRLATVFTLPENIDQQVFLIVPPEALDWARQTGFPLPPETYDVLFIPANQNPDVTLSAPAMFSYIRGQVEISGNALGEGFDFYRIQVGEGLNPRQWLQIGPDGSSPVDNGPLTLWDTGNSNGLFAIQLLVVYQDQSVQTTTIQVTVDNQPPEVEILFPTEDQVLTYPEERSLTFQIQAADNLGIARVEFYVDDDLITTLTQAPFAAPYNAPLGQHTLRVVVYDLAGNAAETTLTFHLQR